MKTLEIMYHPLDASPAEEVAGFTQASDFEFIEVHNPTDLRVSLSGVVISGAFDFSFSGSATTALDPGQYALIVRDRAAFEVRYGTGLPIAGEFGDNTLPDGGQKLANGGEQILITAVDGAVIRNFLYEDSSPWPLSADGPGNSLVLLRPTEFPDHGLAASWRASVLSGGNPGGSDSSRFEGTAGADLDGNGIDDLLDYAIGHAPGAGDGLPVVTLNGGSFAISYRQNLAADDIQLDAFWSDDLKSWQLLGDNFELISVTPDGRGHQTLIYQ
mgnify:CR=1 FL=1